MNAAQGESELVWLVKSGERILGPFSTEEVNQRLRTKEIVVIDEVSLPLSRWRYLRDEPVFAAVVEEIRKGLLSAREDTEVQGHTHTHTQTQTQTMTQTTTDTEPVVAIATNSQAAAVATRSAVGYGPDEVKDAEFTEESAPETARRADTEKNRSVRQYGYDQDKKVQREAGRHSRMLWVAAIVVFVVIAAVLIRFRGPQANGAEQLQAFSHELIAANTAWDHGDFPSALHHYRQADRLIPGSVEVGVRLGVLMLRMEGQTVAAKRILQDVISRSSEPRFIEEAKIGLGLAALTGEEYTEAQRMFSELTASAPNSRVAHFNLGMAAFLNSDYTVAINHFRETIQVAPEESAAYLMLAWAYAKEGKEAFATAGEVLENFLARHSDFRQEALVFSSWLDSQSGEKKRAIAKARAAFDTDPFMTDEHFHDPFLFLDPLKWARLLPLCEKLSGEFKNAEGRALLGVCQLKAGRRTDADALLTDALTVAPENSFYLSANAFQLMTGGRDSDARAALRLADKDGAPTLAWSLTGRNCWSLHDSACARHAWEKLATLEPPHLRALVGMAAILNSEGKRDEALQMLVKAETLSPRYLPAMKLREEGFTQ